MREALVKWQLCFCSADGTAEPVATPQPGSPPDTVGSTPGFLG